MERNNQSVTWSLTESTFLYEYRYEVNVKKHKTSRKGICKVRGCLHGTTDVCQVHCVWNGTMISLFLDEVY